MSPGSASQPLIDPGGRTSAANGRADSSDQVVCRVDQPLSAQPFRQRGGKRAALPLFLHLRRERPDRRQLDQLRTGAAFDRPSVAAVRLDAIAEAEEPIPKRDRQYGPEDHPAQRTVSDHPPVLAARLGRLRDDRYQCAERRSGRSALVWRLLDEAGAENGTEVHLWLALWGAGHQRLVDLQDHAAPDFPGAYAHVLETTQRQFSRFRLALNDRNPLVDPITNLPVDVTEPGFGFTTEAYTSNRFQSSLVGNYERNTVTLAGIHEDREYDIRPDETYISTQLGWTRRLSPYTNLFAGVGWRRTNIDGDGRGDGTSTDTLFGTTAPESDTYSGRVALMHRWRKTVSAMSRSVTRRAWRIKRVRIFRELPDLRRTDRVLMFEDFYKLVGPPFKLGPDHRFFFPSKNHDKALSYLRYGLQQDEGFIVVTGDIGAGKTTLVSQLFPNWTTTVSSRPRSSPATSMPTTPCG